MRLCSWGACRRPAVAVVERRPDDLPRWVARRVYVCAHHVGVDTGGRHVITCQRAWRMPRAARSRVRAWLTTRVLPA